MLKSLIPVLFLPVAALFSITLPAKADLVEIPTYKYFYTCASGVENCATFDLNHNFYGGFGLANVVPTNWPSPVTYCSVTVTPSCYGGFLAIMSNKEGEVLGKAESTTGGGLAYGFNGQ